MREHAKKRHLAQKILSMLISLTLMVSLLPPLQMTAYAAGDITLSVQNDTLSVVNQSGDKFGAGYGQELTSSEAGSTSVSPGIKIYFTDYASGLPAGQVGTVSLSGFNNGSGIGMFHAQANDPTTNYWDDTNATGNMVIEKTDGSSFQFKELNALFGDNLILVIKGYKDNTLVGTVEYTMASVSGSAVTTTLNNANLPTSIFGNVDRVTITGRNYNGTTTYDGRLETVLVFFTKSVTVGDPILPDTTAPVLSAVNVSSIGMNTAALHFNSDEAGTYYYMVCPTSEAAPSAAAIIAQGTAAAKGSGAAAAAANTVNISGLAEGTAYKAYVVEKDAASNASAVSSVDFTTAARTVISSAAIAVTAPVKGAVPSTAASPESAANYTVSAAAWVGNPAKFLGGTAYSAGFTLTPNDGYKFTADTTVTVTGATVTKTLNSNGTISVIADYPALENAALAGITVKTQPTKTLYTYGENFVPAGLTITKTFDDGTTADLTYNDSTKSDFTFSPAVLTAGTSAVVVTYGGKTASIPITVTKQDVAVPVISNSTYTGTAQTAAVADSSYYTVTANAGGTNAGSYPVTLTLKDPENYKWSDSDSAVRSLTFTIAKAAASSIMKTASGTVTSLGKNNAAVTLPELPAGASYGTPIASGIVISTGMSISGTTLTYNAQASQPLQTGTITVPVTGATNYDNYEIVVTITSVERTHVAITGLTAENGIYSGSPVAGYSGTPSYTPGGFTGTLNYEYYLSDGVTRTTVINSGAASEGAAPVYAGSYKVIASIPADDVNYTGSVTLGFTIAKAASAITIAENQSRPFNGAAVTAGASGGDILYNYTGDGVVSVKWYSDDNGAKGVEILAPGSAGTYWIGVSATAGVNYDAAGEVAQKITITPVREINAPPEAEPHGYRLKLQMDTGISSVPAAIAAAVQSLSTPEALKAKLQLSIEDLLGAGGTAVKDFDLILWISRDGGNTWEKATAENFPADGITVVIPWSDLGVSYEQAQYYNFAVTHMFAATVNGHTPGTTENPDWTVTPAGLQFKLNGLSPVAVGYKQLPLIIFEANGGSSVTANAYTALSGKLASLPVPTRSGYSFCGWYTQADGGDMINADTMFTANMTIYAHWNANESGTSSTTADTGVISPRTGDNSHITFWGGLIFAGLLGLAAAIFLRRRRKQKNAC